MEIVKIDNLPISKASVEQVRSEIARKVIQGEIDPVKVQAAIKFYEKVFNGDDKKNNGLNDIIKPYVVDEIGKDAHRKEWYGFNVSLGEAGARYDYSNCNDSELNSLMESKKDLDEKIKERQEFLKSLKRQTPVVNQDGEVEVLNPPLKTSTTSAKFLLK